MDGRNEIFQRLKPPCVALSQAAIALNGPSGNVPATAQRLEKLKHELRGVTTRPASLDAKLADYVFFPLSQVLKASQRVSIRCLELSLQCLAILIDQGWRSQIQPQLTAQIVILCTLMGEKKPQGLASAESTDELQASAFRCLHRVFDAIDKSTESAQALTQDSNVPQIGQTISTLLDGIHDGASTEVQLAATGALNALVKNVITLDIQAGFLPGIVSKLSRVLTPKTAQRRNHAILVEALNILSYLFQSTLGSSSENLQAKKPSKVIDEDWLKSAATQLKPAIVSIVRLRSHGRFDVRESLTDFCFVILKRCQPTLANCGPACLETVLLLSSDDTGDAIKFRLEALVSTDSTALALLQDTLHEWLKALPIKMQAADEDAKIVRMKQINTAYGLVVSSGSDTSLIDRLFAEVLRDSVVVTIQAPGAKAGTSMIDSQIQSLDVAVLDGQHGNTQFDMPLVEYPAQRKIMSSIEQLSKSISTASSSATFAAAVSRSLRNGLGDTQVAAFWLLLDCTKAALDHKHDVDDLLNFEDEKTQISSDHLEELYSLALEVLTAPDDESTDPRLQALALRSLALRAQTAGQEFRFELIDALYPVLHTLATPNEQLQHDSITTLNIFTVACGYESVKDLIVENVDYLTNAVALKLNAFDVSPQAPQVLLMMVRLAGPTLLPYLEDTISSIFAALEDYHGYPLLVELLFKVLSVVAEEGAKAPQLALTHGAHTISRGFQRERWQPSTLSKLESLLKDKANEDLTTPNSILREHHPKKPWKESNAMDQSDEAGENFGEDEDDQRPADTPDPPPPAPKTYNLLLKISELTQHFLPSASASLRTSLLALIKTTIPAIARHENSFLPLINTIWPEIVSRLEDTEPFVVASALDVVANLSEYAGDFMRSRVIQLWPHLMDIHRKTVKEIANSSRSGTAMPPKDRSSTALVSTRAHIKQVVAHMQSSPADYNDTSTRLVWASLVQALTSIVKCIPISPETFDEALDMLEPVLDEIEVREVLEEGNPDAVWLVRMRSGILASPEMPLSIDGVQWASISVAG